MLRSLLVVLLLSLSACASTSSEHQPLAQKLHALAEQNDSQAAYDLGMFYNNGIGVEQSYAEAFKWFQKSYAINQHPLAAYKLGAYYMGQGNAVEPNQELALRYMSEAAQAGYMLAQSDLALIYYQNNDFENMAQWLEKAGAQGDARAYYNLSVLYSGEDKNSTLSPDFAKAYTYFKLAQMISRQTITDNAQETLNSMAKNMSTEQIRQADQFVANWQPQTTDLTISAKNGLRKAYEYTAGK